MNNNIRLPRTFKAWSRFSVCVNVLSFLCFLSYNGMSSHASKAEVGDRKVLFVKVSINLDHQMSDSVISRLNLQEMKYLN